MKNLLFVYGSIKKGFQNDFLLTQENFLGKCKTIEKYSMYPNASYSYPYAIKEDKQVNLVGELYEIINISFDVLDKFEGVPDFYKRELIPVIIDEERYEAFIYFKTNPNLNDYEKDILINNWTKDFEYAGTKLEDFFTAVRYAIKSNKLNEK